MLTQALTRIPARGATLAVNPSANRRFLLNNYLQIKSIHIENSVGNTLPFKFRGPETSKAAVATKMIIFFTVGFFTPFAIARYQMKKSGVWP